MGGAFVVSRILRAVIRNQWLNRNPGNDEQW